MTRLAGNASYLRMPDRSSKGPCDANQLAKITVAIATGEMEDPILTPDGKNRAAVALGRRGGLVGGKKRAESLTPEERKAIAQRAAAARWSK